MVPSPGPFLRKAREAAGLTQAQVAQRMRSTQSAVARLEAPGANPRCDTFRQAITATGHALEIKLEPSGYPPLDETLIASNLRRSPAERLRYFAAAYRNLRELAPTVRDRRGSERAASG
jgi:transcriptional regulator with XRE-family HTH domain